MLVKVQKKFKHKFWWNNLFSSNVSMVVTGPLEESKGNNAKLYLEVIREMVVDK